MRLENINILVYGWEFFTCEEIFGDDYSHTHG
jgi:hypothetical protein